MQLRLSAIWITGVLSASIALAGAATQFSRFGVNRSAGSPRELLLVLTIRRYLSTACLIMATTCQI
jgi:hypothetical protein